MRALLRAEPRQRAPVHPHRWARRRPRPTRRRATRCARFVGARGARGDHLHPRHHRGREPRRPGRSAGRSSPGTRSSSARWSITRTLIPWQMVVPRPRRGAHGRCRCPDGMPTSTWRPSRALLGPRTRVVAVAHVSNVLGTINPVAEIVRRAHAGGRAGAAGRRAGGARICRSTWPRWAADFYVFSGHKMLGPTGIGVLYGRREVLERPPSRPWGGGEMIKEVWIDRAQWNDLPWRFEPGTPPIAEAVGLARGRSSTLDKLGMERVARARARARRAAASTRSPRIAGVTRLRPAQCRRSKGAVVAFNVAGIHPHDGAALLDQSGVAPCAPGTIARSPGQAPRHRGTLRASFSVYNTACRRGPPRRGGGPPQRRALMAGPHGRQPDLHRGPRPHCQSCRRRRLCARGDRRPHPGGGSGRRRARPPRPGHPGGGAARPLAPAGLHRRALPLSEPGRIHGGARSTARRPACSPSNALQKAVRERAASPAARDLDPRARLRPVAPGGAAASESAGLGRGRARASGDLHAHLRPHRVRVTAARWSRRASATPRRIRRAAATIATDGRLLGVAYETRADAAPGGRAPQREPEFRDGCFARMQAYIRRGRHQRARRGRARGAGLRARARRWPRRAASACGSTPSPP